MPKPPLHIEPADTMPTGPVRLSQKLKLQSVPAYRDRNPFSPLSVREN